MLPILLSIAAAPAVELAPGPALPPRTEVAVQDETHLVLQLELERVGVEEVETRGGAYTRVSLPGCGVDPAVGQPELPVCRERVEVPEGAELSLEVEEASWTEVSLASLGLEHPVVPVQAPVPKKPGALESAPWEQDEATYSRSGWFPEDWARLGQEGVIRKHRFVLLEYAPVRYDPVAGKLQVLESARIVLHYRGGDLDETERVQERYRSPAFRGLLDRLVPLPAKHEAKSTPFDLPVGYLVVSADALEDAAATLADFKWAQGYDTTLVTMSEVGGTQQALEDYVKDAYENWEVPPSFLVLVGDTDGVPAGRGHFSRSATDLYYTTMDGDGDLLPDIFVGRLSARTEAQADLLVDKTIRYTLFDFDRSDWVRRATFMASQDNWTVSEGTHDYVISTWLQPAGFDVTTRYSHSDRATIQQVIGDIEAGLSQLTYSGHGEVNEWVDGPAMQPSQVEALQNTDMWPVVQSYACLTGSYDRECFGETWTRANQGAVAYWGSSTESSWTEDDIVERSAYDAWFGDGVTQLRPFLEEGILELWNYEGGQGESRAYCEQYNLFGDPSLDPWTSEPAEMDAEVQVDKSGDELSFDVAVVDAGGSPVPEALVALTSAGGMHLVAWSDAQGRVQLDGSASEVQNGVQVFVSKHDYLPVWEDVDLSSGGGGGGSDTGAAGGDTGPGGPGDDGKVETGKHCGCNAAAPVGGAWLLGLLGPLAWLRRRRD